MRLFGFGKKQEEPEAPSQPMIQAPAIMLTDEVKMLMNLGNEVRSHVNPNGLGVGLWCDGKFITAEPITVTKILLAHSDRGGALKALYEACPCPDCSEFAKFPGEALAIGYRKHFQEFMEGRFDGWNQAKIRARLITYIQEAVEL